MSEKIISNTTNKEIEDCLKRLSELSKPYYNNELSIVELEGLKRNLLGELQYLTFRMGFVKAYKSNNAYFEEHRKRLKSIVLSEILKGPEKVSATAAEAKVYNHPKYKSTLKGIQDVKQLYIQYEDLHKHYQKVLDAVIQSVSVASKELSQNIH